jgi:hypothetical protein
MAKLKECSYCGQHKNSEIDVIEDPNDANQNICSNCIDFFRYQFKRSHHKVWVIGFALNRLHEMIRKEQKKLTQLITEDELGIPFISKYENDTRQKRIDSCNEFLEQYYDLYKFINQMHRIVKHRDMIADANAIVNFLKRSKP